MPELNWRYGYPAALSVMLASTLVLRRAFRRNHWLLLPRARRAEAHPAATAGSAGLDARDPADPPAAPCSRSGPPGDHPAGTARNPPRIPAAVHHRHAARLDRHLASRPGATDSDQESPRAAPKTAVVTATTALKITPP